MWQRTRHPLGRSPLLQDASTSVVNRLGSFVTPISVPAGRVLVTEGEHNAQFVLLERGTVSVVRGGELVAELGPGDFVGELSLLGDGRATATVTTTSPVEAYVSSSREFDALLRSTIGDAIRSAAAQRLAS